MPSKKILEQIVYTVLQAREDAMPLVSWKRDAFHCEIRRYRDKLYLIDVSFLHTRCHNQQTLASKEQREEQQKEQQYTLSEQQAIFLHTTNTSIKLSSANEAAGQYGFDRQKLLSKIISVRFRKGGERLRKTPDGHSHPLKHWFQEQSIPPWEREHMPLIYWGDELIQIGNHIVNYSLKNEQSGDLLSIHWQTIKNK